MKSLVLSLLLTFVFTHANQAQDAPASRAFDVKSFGAAGDGKTLDHTSINRAINAAHDAGGGVVRLPAGTYLCFSIHLQSHVTLQFDPGATILAADPGVDPGGYDAAEPNPAELYQDFGHTHWHNSLIWGENLENVAIIGPGLIRGRGLSSGWTGTAAQPPPPAPGQPAGSLNPAENRFPKQKFGYPNARDSLRDGIGNKSIALKNCRDVTLRDFSVLRGGHFAILVTGVDHLSIDHVKLDTNRDGMDIDACRDVHVTDCSVNSPSDDAICLKASYGLGVARDTEDVTITGCTVSADYQEGTMLDGTWKHFAPEEKRGHNGRIKFGTESTGGFRRIAISNCVFDHCQGLAIESVDGGIIEDVAVSNLTMHDIVGSPIFIRLGSRLRSPEGAVTGAIRRVVIDNVTVSGASGPYGSILSGVPGHPLEDVLISNVRAVQGGGGTAADAARKPPEKEDAYPEPNMFGTMPSWGFYVRHCAGLELRSVGLRLEKADARPCVVLEDVNGAEFYGLKVPARTEGQPLFRLREVKDFVAHDCAGVPDTVRDTVTEGAL